jgi:WD40 repeat protein
LISGGGDQTIKVWDVPTGKARTTIKWPARHFIGLPDYHSWVALSPDGQMLLAAFGQDIYVWDLSEPARAPK